MKLSLFVGAFLVSTAAFALDLDQLNEHRFQELAKRAAAVNTAAKVLAEGDLSCEKPSDCLAIAGGDRACGGPNFYLVASKKNKDLGMIKNLLKLGQKAEDEANQVGGRASICMFEMPPTVGCVENRCAAVQPQF